MAGLARVVGEGWRGLRNAHVVGEAGRGLRVRLARGCACGMAMGSTLYV